MNPAELSFFLGNFITVADANKAELNITSATITSLIDVKTLLDTKIANRQTKQEEAVAATSEMNQTAKNAVDLVSLVNNSVKSDKAIPESLIELLGLDPDDNNFTPIVPLAPTDLVVEGRSNGINYLRWNNGGNKPRITYIVEAKIGEALVYSFVKATTKTRFEHKNQMPGVRAFYRVRAVHGDLESPNSNEAVVYN